MIIKIQYLGPTRYMPPAEGSSSHSVRFAPRTPVSPSGPRSLPKPERSHPSQPPPAKASKSSVREPERKRESERPLPLFLKVKEAGNKGEAVNKKTHTHTHTHTHTPAEKG